MDEDRLKSGELMEVKVDEGPDFTHRNSQSQIEDRDPNRVNSSLKVCPSQITLFNAKAVMPLETVHIFYISTTVSNPIQSEQTDVK